MKRRRRSVSAGLLALMLVLSMLLVSCGSGDDSGDAAGAATSGGQTGPAPDFSGTTIDGEQVSLGGFAGKPTILIFWASW